MKLTFILIFAFTFFAKADVIAQKVTVSVHNERIEEVFFQISKQTNYKFFYDALIFKDNSKISLKVKHEPIEDVLMKALNNTPYEFKIVSNTVLISSRLKYQPSIVSAQLPITGTVKDNDGNPLPGATVAVKNKANVKVMTNTDGRFTINAAKGDVLLVSYLGFKPVETLVEDQRDLTIQLENMDKLLGEVVVVGYGTQKQREISGSVTNLSEKDFNKGVTKNAVDLLRGKVAGLTITSGSGDVSAGETIRLRGTSSLTGSSAPFVVIDGVPGLSLNAVAPQDIASISILKDASAAAIYGSRSAGGVILITTKKGSNTKPVINYDGYAAIDEVSNKPKMLSASDWRKYARDQNLDVSGLDMGADTDWFDEILRQGISQNHSASLSGGGENSYYRASVNYLDRQGIAKGNDLQNLNSRLSFTQKALDNKLEITFTGAVSQRDYSPTDGRNFVLAYNMVPVYPVKNADGSWFDRRGYDEGNPVRNIEFNRRDNKGNLFYLNTQAKIEIFKGFFGRVNALKERENNDYGSYNHSETERGRDDQGFASRENWIRDRRLIETTVEYVKSPFEDHNLTLLGGYSYEDNYYQGAGARSRQFVTDFFEYNNLGAGENLRAGDVWSNGNMNKLISFFGRVNYAIKERYIITAALRRDGSSKFGANHKWGTFPSMSAAWNISNESFMKDKSLFNDLKLRAGYGVVGNQDGLNPYQTLQLYSASGRYYDNGNWFQAYQIGQNANPDLKWEETSMLNVGLDYSILNGRINGVIEFYDKKTKDLLYMYQVPVPPYLYPTMIANVGTMSNKGIEFLINVNPVKTNKFSWDVSLNMAHNKNEITKLSNANFSTSSIKLGSAAVRGAATTTTHIIEEGREVGTFYGWKNLGLDDAGKYIMDDMIDGKAGLTDDDRTYIGSAQPKLTYGISNSFTYKRLDLSFFLRGVYGNDVLNFSRMAYATTLWLPGGNVLAEALTNGLTDNPKYSSYNIEKGSFLRLDNASLGYNFDTKRIKGLKGLRLYLNAQNLFIITNYKGLDPEVDMSGLAPGMESRDYYPKAKTLSIGLNVTL